MPFLSSLANLFTVLPSFFQKSVDSTQNMLILNMRGAVPLIAIGIHSTKTKQNNTTQKRNKTIK